MRVKRFCTRESARARETDFTQQARGAFEISSRTWRWMRVPNSKAHYAQEHFYGVHSQTKCAEALLYRLLRPGSPVLYRPVYNQIHHH
jgi:hypothetical protein